MTQCQLCSWGLFLILFYGQATVKLRCRPQVGWNEGPGFVLSRRGAKLQRLVKDQVEETILLGTGP